MARTKKNKGIKDTNDSVFAVTLYGDTPVVSTKKMQVSVEEITEESVVMTMRQPRSSKRIKRMIPRDEFVAFSYNEDTGEASFILPPVRSELMTVVGTVELNGGYVYVTEEDGTIHIFHEEDVEIMAKAESESRRGRRKKIEAEEEEEYSDDDEDDSDEDDEEEDDEEEEAPKRGRRRARRDEDDDSDEDDDEEDDDSDDDSDEDDEEEDDEEDDSDDDSDEDDEEEDDDSDDDSDEDDDEDDDEEEEAPKRGRARRGRK